jgi:hypothetical protein
MLLNNTTLGPAFVPAPVPGRINTDSNSDSSQDRRRVSHQSSFNSLPTSGNSSFQYWHVPNDGANDSGIGPGSHFNDASRYSADNDDDVPHEVGMGTFGL